MELDPDAKEAIHNLLEELQRLWKAKLKLSPKKYTLFQKKVKHLGHVISSEGVAMDGDKVRALQDWPRPKNVTELKGFLGLCSYFRRFIPSFADVAAPLREYTRKSHPFEWSPAAEDAFQRLKLALIKRPILGYPDPDGPFALDTDASNLGIGAVLSQQQDGQERVIAYYNKVLSQTERNYCTTRREVLAVVKVIRHFHSYLYGRPFNVRSDNAVATELPISRRADSSLDRISPAV